MFVLFEPVEDNHKMCEVARISAAKYVFFLRFHNHKINHDCFSIGMVHVTGLASKNCPDSDSVDCLVVCKC